MAGSRSASSVYGYWPADEAGLLRPTRLRPWAGTRSRLREGEHQQPRRAGPAHLRGAVAADAAMGGGGPVTIAGRYGCLVGAPRLRVEYAIPGSVAKVN